MLSQPIVELGVFIVGLLLHGAWVSSSVGRRLGFWQGQLETRVEAVEAKTDELNGRVYSLETGGLDRALRR